MDFNDVSNVALDFMNRDHQEATDLINQLLSLISATENGEAKIEEINTLLAELFTHNSEHFAREEEQMLKFNFPAYPIHKAAHERVIAEMTTKISSWQRNNDLPHLKEYIGQTLPDWFIGHVETMDTMTAMFVVRSGG